MSKYYRTVKELPDDCLYDLKDRMFCGLDGKDPLFDCYECANDIPDELVFRRYKGREFSPEDFWDDGGSWDDFTMDFTAFSQMTAPLDAINNWLAVFAN